MKVSACLYCGNKKLVYITHRSDDNGILKCLKCGVMMVEHISDDTEQLYTAEYFEKPEDNKSGYTNYLSSPVANLLGKYAFTHLFARQSGRHLDLGCADGSLMEIFGGEGFDSRGLEISKDAVAIAQTKGLNVTFSKLDAFPVDMPKSNVITAFDLLEHADKPGNVLKETYKNLEDDGYFVFSTLSVQRNDPTDYWFNHSLEHYVYYNEASLTYILSEVFGAESFGFVEMEINGIAEFWGFAKKGKVTWEKEVINRISQGDFDKKKADDGYLLSLFYNQLSKFSESEKIITHFSPVWSQGTSIQAKFYNNYYQGKFEAAIRESQQNRHLVSAKNSVYWQALSHAEEELFQIKENDMGRLHNEEVMELRGQVFRLRDELHTLRASRIIGKVIRAREYAGRQLPRFKRLPRRLMRELKKIVSKVLPENLKKVLRKIRSLLRRLKRKTLRIYHQQLASIKTVANKPWPKKLPLVSVVIPYYNRADTIDDTLVSLVTQTFRNFEVIIVDDGSTDPVSIEKIQALEKSNPEITFSHQQNQGVAAARNFGITQAKGKYIICLDSDDMLEPTFIEKSLVILETSPDISLVSTNRHDFGVLNEQTKYIPYDPLRLFDNNMVITAAAFRKDAWKKSGGYKSGIGYEDWEFWLNLSEHGFWGTRIPEPLFQYRTSMQSRYVEDKDIHWSNIKSIRALHQKYKKKIKKLLSQRQYIKHVIDPQTAFINLDDQDAFQQADKSKPNILITIPWMTFGGAETLIYNYCREVKDKFNITFATGLSAEHEWEYKFKEITPAIYHLANLFEDKELHLEFLSNYIRTRNIDILHIIHNGFTFDMLPELKKRHPNLKVVVTMFNDRVEYFEQSIPFEKYIDSFVSDNTKVADHYKRELAPGAKAIAIPNGINCYAEFSPDLFDRSKERAALGIGENDLAVFFVGRLSQEKNPDVFLMAAKKVLSAHKGSDIKFFVIGDGPMRPEVEKQITALGSQQVMYLGYQTEVSKYLSTADVFVLPSSIEGFPMSILEAMAMKVAVIASDVGAVSEVIDSGREGFVVPAGSVKDIVSCIEVLKKDPKLLKALKVKARQKVEKKYSNIVLGTNYTKLYKELKK